MQDTTPDGTPDPVIADGTRHNDPDGKPVTFNIKVTQADPELQAIEATLVLLQMLPYDTRVRALTYIRDRIESDPGVWGTAPARGTRGTPATHSDIAQILAESDGRDWHVLTTEHQSPYYRRAQALSSVGFVVMADGA